MLDGCDSPSASGLPAPQPPAASWPTRRPTAWRPASWASLVLASCSRGQLHDPTEVSRGLQLRAKVKLKFGTRAWARGPEPGPESEPRARGTRPGASGPAAGPGRHAIDRSYPTDAAPLRGAHPYHIILCSSVHASGSSDVEREAVDSAASVVGRGARARCGRPGPKASSLARGPGGLVPCCAISFLRFPIQEAPAKCPPALYRAVHELLLVLLPVHVVLGHPLVGHLAEKPRRTTLVRSQRCPWPRHAAAAAAAAGAVGIGTGADAAAVGAADVVVRAATSSSTFCDSRIISASLLLLVLITFVVPSCAMLCHSCLLWPLTPSRAPCI